MLPALVHPEPDIKGTVDLFQGGTGKGGEELGAYGFGEVKLPMYITIYLFMRISQPSLRITNLLK